MRNFFISSVCMLALTTAPTWADTGRSGFDSANHTSTTSTNTSTGTSTTTTSGTATSGNTATGTATTGTSTTASLPAAATRPSVSLTSSIRRTTGQPERSGSTSEPETHAAHNGVGKLFCNVSNAATDQANAADWRVFKRSGVWQTCIFHRGDACCWGADQSPPDVSYGDGEQCARNVCRGDYDAEATQALPLDAIPTAPVTSPTVLPNSCARDMLLDGTGTPSPILAQWAKDQPDAVHGRCVACCDNADAPDSFYSACEQACDSAFLAPAEPTGADYARAQCLPQSTISALGALLVDTQRCNTCCRMGALGGDYPIEEFRQCIGTCRQ